MSAVWKSAYGAEVDLLAPDWRAVSIDDIARALSLTNRWAGNSRRAFSVAQHSLVVAGLAHPQVRLAALLHDAHEAFLGDWTRPGIEALAQLGGEAVRAARAKLTRGLDIAVARRVLEDAEARTPFGAALEASLLADEMAGPIVGRADDEALRWEDATRGMGSLQNGPSRDVARALEAYGAFAPSDGVVMIEWVRAVRHAAFERYAGEGP